MLYSPAQRATVVLNEIPDVLPQCNLQGKVKAVLKDGEVERFSETSSLTARPIGFDAHFYRSSKMPPQPFHAIRLRAKKTPLYLRADARKDRRR